MSRDYKGQKAVDEAPLGYVQVLPMSDLPPDFTGDPQDGAQYLALRHAEGLALPFVTIAPNYRPTIGAPDPYASYPSASTSTSSTNNPSSSSSRARHPALPTESWITSYRAHFVNYKQTIMDRPLSSGNEKGISMGKVNEEQAMMWERVGKSNSKVDWLGFVDGVKRKKLYKRDEEKGDGGGEEAGSGGDSETSEEEDADEDEEEEVNDSLVGILDGSQEQFLNNEQNGGEGEEKDGEIDYGDGNWEDMEEAMGNEPKPTQVLVLEPELEKHKPHEPLFSFIRGLTEFRQMWLIEVFTEWINASLDKILFPKTYLSTEPSTGESLLAPIPLSQQNLIILPPHWSKWLFALLVCLPQYLLSDDLNTLRELAKVCRKVVKWQVQSGLWDEDESLRGQGQEEMRKDCWLIHEAVVAGWAQKDLGFDAEAIFAKLMV